MSMKEQILELRERGFTYKQIIETLGCSSGTVSYHLGPGQKGKNLERQRKRRASDPLLQKLENFRDRKCLQARVERLVAKGSSITLEQAKQLVVDTDSCYLCGKMLDYSNSNLYHFDHIVPTFLGGSNSIDNLGITHSICNMAKTNMGLDEFVDLCYTIAKNHGRN
jgi:5-methylcytosine-specific restriction endonuclease McrA